MTGQLQPLDYQLPVASAISHRIIKPEYPRALAPLYYYLFFLAKKRNKKGKAKLSCRPLCDKARIAAEDG